MRNTKDDPAKAVHLGGHKISKNDTGKKDNNDNKQDPDAPHYSNDPATQQVMELDAIKQQFE